MQITYQIYPIFVQVGLISQRKRNMQSLLNQTLCMLGNVSCFCCHLPTFFKLTFFKKLFQEHFQGVKQFGSRSGLMEWTDILSVLFQTVSKVISKRQKLPLARNELNISVSNGIHILNKVLILNVDEILFLLRTWIKVP